MGFSSGPWDRLAAGAVEPVRLTMAWAPAVFRDLRSLACRFGKLFGWTPLEWATPWAFAWGIGTKCLGLLSELRYSDSSQQKTHKITTKPKMLDSDTLFVFSLFVACAYLENYKVRSGEGRCHRASVYCSRVKHSVCSCL